MNKLLVKKPLLYFQNFSFSYHKKSSDNKALKKINFKIYSHTITAIIGPSGCGKTTFLQSINRIHELKYDSIKIEGNIFFQDQPIYNKKNNLNHLRKKIGLVFQKPAPFPISIRDNLLFAPKIHGLTKVKNYDALVEKSLKQTNLWEEVKDILDRSALKLSGGQQQRLCIARCLANEPEIILMDEPTSSLDPISREKIENLIITLKSKYTIILVTHSLNQASRISDNVVFLDKGEIVESGKTKHIFSEPQHKKTQDYINGKSD